MAKALLVNCDADDVAYIRRGDKYFTIDGDCIDFQELCKKHDRIVVVDRRTT